MKNRLVTLIPLLIFTALCAAAENPPAERKSVGHLGMPSAIEITGAKTFTAADLRSALTGSYAYLLAAHPSAPVHSYVATVEALLVKGYRAAGFRDARVTAAVSKAGDRLLVQVEEGRKFAQGDIRIEGVPAALAAELIGVLTAKPGPVPETLADRVTDFIEDRAEQKRKAAAEKIAVKLGMQPPSSGGVSAALDISATESGGSFLGNSLKRQQRTDPFWERGERFSFEGTSASANVRELRTVLAERGKSLMGVKAKTTEDDATGRVDLTYYLTDAPDAVVGDILVKGNKRDTAAEIIAASRLKKGASFTSDTIRQANVALWNSARFLNFDLTSAARDGQRPEVDITVDVEEDAKMQPLREPLTREQQALVRLAGWMTTEFAKREVAIRITDDSKNEAALAISPRAGYAVVFTGAAKGMQMLGVHGGVEKSLVVAASGARAAAREFDNTRGMFTLKLELIPSPRDRGVDGQMKSFNFSSGYSTETSKADDERAAVRTEIIVAPVVFCSEDWARSGSALKFEDGTVRAEFGDKEAKASIRFVEASGELIAVEVSEDHFFFFETAASVFIGVKAGEVARIRGVLEDARRGHEPAKLAEESVLELLATSPAVAEFSMAILKENDLKIVGLTARLVEKVMGSFLAKFLETPPEVEGQPVFSIPIDPAAPTSVLANLMGAMLFQWAQEMWPPDAWPAKLTREIFYVATGNTTYTARVLDELYQDPKMGPFGSHATAQLLAKMDPAGARRFLRRARERSSAEDLRREMELLLDVRGKGRGIVRDLIGEFEKLDLDSITLLAGSLGPEFAEDARHWRADLAKMHDRPPAEVLLPHLLRGWERGGRAKFVEKMDDLLATSGPDPWNVAAVVNGEPVSRKWVERLGPALRIHELIPPRPVPAGEKQRDAGEQTLDALVSLRLVQQDFQRSGGKLLPEMQQKTLEWIARGNLPELEQAVTRAGVMQAELSLLAQQCVSYTTFVENLKGSLKPPGAEELKAAVDAKLKEFAERIHLRIIRGPKADDGRAALDGVRAQVAEKGFKALWDAVEAKKDGGFEAGEYEDLDRETLNEALTKAAFALNAGQTGAIIESGDFCYLLHVVSKGASEKTSDETRKAAEGKVAEERLAKAVAEHIERLRARATIEVLELPPMRSAPPPPPGATRLEGEALKVLEVHDAEAHAMPMKEWGAEHWSGGTQVIVSAKEGGWVEWEFAAPEARAYRFVLHATRAGNFGKITVAIDGRKFDESVDLYAGGAVIPTGARTLGERDLSQGAHKLRITVEKGNPEASGFDFGFDALDLIPSVGQPVGVGKKH